jgi:hypothetical protein
MSLIRSISFLNQLFSDSKVDTLSEIVIKSISFTPTLLLRFSINFNPLILSYSDLVLSSLDVLNYSLISKFCSVS